MGLIYTQAAVAAPYTPFKSVSAGYGKRGADIPAITFGRSTAFSIGGWCKAAASGGTGDEYIITKINNQVAGGYYLYNTGTNTLQAWMGLQGTGGQNMYRFATSALNDGLWHFVVGTYDGSNTIAGLKLYVDAAQPASTTSGVSLATDFNTAAPFTIGAIYNNGVNSYTSPYKGKLNELFVYSGELSSSEITAFYNLGAPVDLSLRASYSANLGWWKYAKTGEDGTTFADDKSGNTLTGVSVTLSTDVP